MCLLLTKLLGIVNLWDLSLFLVCFYRTFFHNLVIKVSPGSILPNFVHQAKRRRCTAIDEKFVIQFHQLNVKAKIMSKFAKIVCCLSNDGQQKSFSFCLCEQFEQKCWWNRPLSSFKRVIRICKSPVSSE